MTAPDEPPERPLVERQVECFFQSCQLVTKYMDDLIRPRLEKSKLETKREEFTYGMFLRALGWMRSLGKLNGVSDFQAVVTANRSMFESLIDVILLHYDSKGTEVERMEAWEHSHRFKHAKRVVDHYTELREPVPDEYKSAEAFVDKFKPQMDGLRLKFWPTKKDATKGHHPAYWSDDNLENAAKHADTLTNLGLYTYYKTRYHWLCMNVHGSTTVGVRGLRAETFHSIMGVSLGDCGDLGMDITKYTIMTIDSIWEKESDFQKYHDVTNKKRKEIATRASR